VKEELDQVKDLAECAIHFLQLDSGEACERTIYESVIVDGTKLVHKEIRFFAQPPTGWYSKP
jgi:hypothetical protein